MANRAVLLAIAVYFTSNTISKSVLVPNMEAMAIAYVYYIIVLLFGFVKILREIEYLHIQQSPLFILYAGFFIYCSGITLILLFEHFFSDTDEAFINQLWILCNIFNIIKHAAIGYYFVLKRKRS